MTETAVLLLAFLSRLFVLIATRAADCFLPDYDTSSELQSMACRHVTDTTSALNGQGSPFGQTKFVWDSVFFARIAMCGYEYEQFYAFFPALPGLLKLASAIVQSCGVSADLLGSFVVEGLSMIAFLASVVFLHRLSVRTLRCSKLADMATLLFMWNPASIFYSAAYTESIFACFAFTGYCHVAKQPWTATIWFCAASATRSNGVLNCWFVLHRLLKALLQDRKQLRSSQWLGPILQAGTQCLIICLPVMAFQYAAWLTFCQGATTRPWCSNRLPNVYSFVQSHHWGVGLFKYFKTQQIPNFVLAAPILYLSCMGCWTYLNCNWSRALSLGLQRSQLTQIQRHDKHANALTDHSATAMAASHSQAWSAGFTCDAVSPYSYHWGLLTACALFVMNVQVATRFLSACPALYWYIASIAQPKKSKWIWQYFLMYFCLGTILFPNFYPWT